MRLKTSVLSAGFRLLGAYACYRPRLRVLDRRTEPAIPFPPPLRKAELSAFPPVAEKGPFSFVLVLYPNDCVGAVSAGASAIRALAISCTRLRSTLA